MEKEFRKRRLGTANQSEVVARHLKKKRSIDMLEKLTGFLRPNIRRILHLGTKQGKFQKIARGIYVLKNAEGTFAYLQAGDASYLLSEVDKLELKFDMVFLDIPYFSKNLVGRNRGIVSEWQERKYYNFITPEYFDKFCAKVKTMMRRPESVAVLMLSGAPSTQPDMEAYFDAAAKHFHCLHRGEWHKLSKEFKPILNVRGKIAAPEKIYFFTRNKNIDPGFMPMLYDKTNDDLVFRMIRPPIRKSYPTQKPAELLREILHLCSKPLDIVLDPFCGSGTMLHESIKNMRSCIAFDTSKLAISKTIKNAKLG